MDTSITIIADYRENPSGIPEILRKKGVHIELKNLKTGDYIVKNNFIVERKSKDDFVLSIIQNRLFPQCARLKRSFLPSALLIEGNPYTSSHNISRSSIKGALLSVTLAWQIPIVYTSGKKDTADSLIMAAQQAQQHKPVSNRMGYKPKSILKRQAYFLQGLPLVGKKTALALIVHFGSMEKIINATEIELSQVKGVGKEKAIGIKKFLTKELSHEKRTY